MDRVISEKDRALWRCYDLLRELARRKREALAAAAAKQAEAVAEEKGAEDGKAGS